MALTKGTNSYATVEEADAYFEDRIDVAAWTNGGIQKEAALVTATAIIDREDWGGYAVDADQALAFPRVHSYYDPKVGGVVTLSTTETPKRILEACYEIAHHLLNNDGVLDSVSSVESLTVGPIKLEGIKSASAIPQVAYDLMRPLLELAASGNILWRAN